MDDKIGFGIRIKEMREYRKLTIEEAAEQCDGNSMNGANACQVSQS